MPPDILITRYVRRRMIQDAKVAAICLRHCPEFITNTRPDETVDQFLRRMGSGTVRNEVILRITEHARVNGCRPIRGLKVYQRHALADQLEDFAAELA